MLRCAATGQGSPSAKDDGQLFDEATAMLKAELARLGAETVKKMEVGRGGVLGGVGWVGWVGEG